MSELSQQLWIAFALFLILEGLLPSIAPCQWKKTFAQILQLTDSQLRLMGVVSMLIGLALLHWLH